MYKDYKLFTEAVNTYMVAECSVILEVKLLNLMEISEV